MIPGFRHRIPALITRAVDGDTLAADLDRGDGLVHRNRRIRIEGLWSPETARPGKPAEPGGVEAAAFAASLFSPPSIPIAVFETYWDRSLERFVGSIKLLDGRDFATVMIEASHGFRTLRELQSFLATRGV